MSTKWSIAVKAAEQRRAQIRLDISSFFNAPWLQEDSNTWKTQPFTCLISFFFFPRHHIPPLCANVDKFYTAVSRSFWSCVVNSSSRAFDAATCVCGKAWLSQHQQFWHKLDCHASRGTISMVPRIVLRFAKFTEAWQALTSKITPLLSQGASRSFSPAQLQATTARVTKLLAPLGVSPEAFVNGSARSLMPWDSAAFDTLFCPLHLDSGWFSYASRRRRLIAIEEVCFWHDQCTRPAETVLVKYSTEEQEPGPMEPLDAELKIDSLTLLRNEWDWFDLTMELKTSPPLTFCFIRDTPSSSRSVPTLSTNRVRFNYAFRRWEARTCDPDVTLVLYEKQDWFNAQVTFLSSAIEDYLNRDLGNIVLDYLFE